MKTARVSLWPNAYKQAQNQPDFTGSVDLPAALVQELAQAMAAGYGMTANPMTGEQVFRLRLSAWRGQPGANAPALSGQITSLSEQAAFDAQKQQRQGANPQAMAPAPIPQAVAPIPQAMAPAPQAAPVNPQAPAANPAAGGWGNNQWSANPAI
jgi:hypothetical protein